MRCHSFSLPSHAISETFNTSFSFRWPRFSDKFHSETMDLLTTALNKGNKPPIIEDKIEVVELEMGTQASFARFVCIFKV